MGESALQSTVSEQSRLLQSTASASASGVDQADRQAVSVGLFCLSAFGVLLVVMIIVLLTVALVPSYPNDDFTDTVEDIYGGRGDGGARGGGDDSKPPSVVITERATRVTPTRGFPHAKTGAPEIDRSTKRPLPLGSLICTVRTPFTVTFVNVPPDGLCTIIVAYPFYSYQGLTLDPNVYVFEGFQNILDVSEQQTKTEYGVGIDYDFCGSSEDMTKLVTDPATKKALDLMWSKRVYHYAQVNPPIGFPGELRNVIPNCGKGLKSLFDLMKDKTDNVDRPSYIMYSFPLYDPTDFPDVGGFLSASPVDIFIAHGYHSEEDAGFSECHMIPPTLFTKQLLSPDVYGLYSIRLANSIWSMTVNPQAWSPTTSFAVSVGLGARWYKPQDSDNDPNGPGNYRLGNPCINERRADLKGQISGISFGCSKKSYNDSLMVDPVFQAMVGYDKSEGFLFTFDSGETLRQKLCEAKGNVTDLQLKIVASNIGNEDYLNQCGLGPLPRLRMLKALSLFFADNYTSSADKSRCLMVRG